MKNIKKTYRRYTQFEHALKAASESEQENIQSQIDYNPAEAKRQISHIQSDLRDYSFDAWYVIDGKVYYRIEMDGKEKGLKLLHKLELTFSCMTSTPFIRVQFIGERSNRLFIDADDAGEAQGYKRSLKARREYARLGWTMTTDYEVAA